MKINQIIVNESMGGTCAGAVATVESPMGSVQTRSPVKGLQPAEKVIKGKSKKKGPYQNSIVEGKKDKVAEAELQEDDLIVIPGHGMKRKTGFVQHGQSRVDHEVDMARSDLIASYKNAKAIFDMLKDRSEEEGIEGWVQEKLIKAADYLNAVKEYLDGKMAQESIPHGGVIAGGGVGEGVAEGSEQNLSVQQLATISDEALDKAYGYGRSNPGNSFGWQANLMSAAYAKKMIDAGVTDIEKISDAIHKGWNVTAQKFVQDPDQFSDTEKLRQAGKLEAKLQQRAKLMKINYAQLDNEEQEKDRVVARALLQAIKGQQDVAKAQVNEKFASQQQAKLMYAVAGDKDVAKKTGVSQKVAKEFIKKSHGQKVKSLPKKVKKKD